jgi:hypothetical protein
MQDIYLSFTDEAESLPILYTIVPDSSEMTPNYQNISVIGTVYQRPPEPTPKDYEPIPYPVPNYGVNIRLLEGEDIEPLRPYMVYPTDPIRVWA